jgi:hypothetical protein
MHCGRPKKRAYPYVHPSLFNNAQINDTQTSEHVATLVEFCRERMLGIH